MKEIMRYILYTLFVFVIFVFLGGEYVFVFILTVIGIEISIMRVNKYTPDDLREYYDRNQKTGFFLKPFRFIIIIPLLFSLSLLVLQAISIDLFLSVVEYFNPVIEMMSNVIHIQTSHRSIFDKKLQVLNLLLMIPFFIPSLVDSLRTNRNFGLGPPVWLGRPALALFLLFFYIISIILIFNITTEDIYMLSYRCRLDNVYYTLGNGEKMRLSSVGLCKLKLLFGMNLLSFFMLLFVSQIVLMIKIIFSNIIKGELKE